MIARRAAERVTGKDRKGLRAIEATMRRAVKEKNYAAFSQSNAALHRDIQRMAGNETANRILQTLKSHLVRLQYRVILLPGRPESSLAEHRAVIDAICAGDGDAAEKAMRLHLLNFKRLLAQAIDAARHGGF
jgi:DNA-binding GntR family transcriptional regulator